MTLTFKVCVQQLDFLSFRAGCRQPSAIRAEGNKPHCSIGFVQSRFSLSGFCVPYLGRSVATCGCDQLSIGAEFDLLDSFFVALQPGYALESFHIVNRHDRTYADQGDILTVRAEDTTDDRACSFRLFLGEYF